ncbi:MAG: DUF721 domain-containing protein [Planctomycetes bacterium]|nr:DUF721 domain-containing protein [Planctomycetota bacterium]
MERQGPGRSGGAPGGRLEASDFAPERAEPVGDVLRRWAARTGISRASDRERIWNAWQRLLGAEAAHTILEGLRSRGPGAGVAMFVVDSSTLLSELRSFRRQELLEGLRREVKTYFVQDLKFRLEKRRPRPCPGLR